MLFKETPLKHQLVHLGAVEVVVLAPRGSVNLENA